MAVQLSQLTLGLLMRMTRWWEREKRLGLAPSYTTHSSCKQGRETGCEMGAVIKSLEPYSGPYAVSTTDLELPVPAPRRRQFPLPTLKHSQGEPALKLETVLFTLFYPADETRPGSGHAQPWVQRPVDVTAAGYSRFLGQREDLCRWMFKLAGESLHLPAEADRPLAPPPTTASASSTAAPSSSSADRIRAETSERGAFPLIIFSHGMSGQRTTYRSASSPFLSLLPLQNPRKTNNSFISHSLVYNGLQSMVRRYCFTRIHRRRPRAQGRLGPD